MPETGVGYGRGGLRIWLAAAAMVLPCVSCTSKSVQLENAKTGEKFTCSVYYPVFGEPNRTRMIEFDDCIREHRTRGFTIVSPQQR